MPTRNKDPRYDERDGNNNAKRDETEAECGREENVGVRGLRTAKEGIDGKDEPRRWKKQEQDAMIEEEAREWS